MKLDIACGAHKQPGFVGVDIADIPGVDEVMDLFRFPWRFPDSSVDTVFCSHFFEHVPAKLRARFMDEVWRILKPGAQAVFITPMWNSVRAIQDFTHEWPPIAPESFLYFNAATREASGLTHMGIGCDFDLGRQMEGEDLTMILTARKSA